MKRHPVVAGCVGSILLVALAGCATKASNTSASNENAIEEQSSAALPADYQQKLATEKQDILWNDHLAPSKYDALPAWPSVDLLGIARLDLGITLNRNSDELPVGRKKLVHALGACAKVELVPAKDSPYTGMFKGGVGIVRFSLAAPPGTDSFTPAIAIKMFIDGMPSQNLQVMYSVDGQGTDFDFFANRFTNILPTPTGFGPTLIGKIFIQATPFPNHVDLDNFARHEQTGAMADHMHAPHQVFFIATADAKSVARASSSDVDFRDDLANIPADTAIYDIIGSDSADGAFIPVGQLVTRSEVISAKYGDENLFFKHEEAGTSD